MTLVALKPPKRSGIKTESTTGPILQCKCACGAKAKVSGKCTECVENTRKGVLQRKATSKHDVDEVPPIVYDVLRSSGQPLDPETRAFFEPRFGQDFSRVRIHRDDLAGQSADAINAIAYAVGEHVVFRAGAYAPTTTEGRGILAHELTHVVQSPRSSVDFGALRLAVDSDSLAERIANATQAQMTSGQEFSTMSGVVQSSTIHRLRGSPAGGCGLCYGSTKEVGKEAHKRIQSAFRSKYGSLILSETEMPVVSPSSGDESGRLDLASPIALDEIAIGEIKPANLAGVLQGDLDLFWYEDQLRGLGMKTQRLRLPPPLEPIPFPTLAPPNCPQYQNLYVDPPFEGVYTYWCIPDFSQLIKTCKCNDKRRKPKERVLENPVPVPVPVPNPVPRERHAPHSGPAPQPVPVPQPQPVPIPFPPVPVPVPSPGPTQEPEPERIPDNVIPFPGRPSPAPENETEPKPIPIAARWNLGQIITALLVIGLSIGIVASIAACLLTSPTGVGVAAFCGLTAVQFAALMLILNSPSQSSKEA
jgi:hypothetical protein